MHCLKTLSQRYPQLLVPISEGARTSETYKSLVLRGQQPPEDLVLTFSLDSRDALTLESTPAGEAEILFLQDRADFEHAVQALANRCEPEAVPPSMGAIALSGLIDWGKINAHKKEWLEAGNFILDWGAEFQAFTADRSNIRGSIIILSSGPYSAVSASAAGLPENEWLEKSITIRKFHELAHFVSRRMFPENENAIRDELVADFVGLWAAYGFYDKQLALRFLGLENEGIREDGRLVNYLHEGESLEEAAKTARAIVDALDAFAQGQTSPDCFEVLQCIEKERVGF